ncbi:MAG: hypothetical protein RM368_38140 [Nostoc sp. DedSLP03]|uniref:hypothetical protein n=1 Tax=Nostoc sp. DedSLP03 TaxID=3075400 RepID=UPI002AD242E7|nr:hypothetical protein [Nostoc sp. DedSLP03]MDZ7970683.1 hypothetical protein [Nostoc sp. DedSLP03]
MDALGRRTSEHGVLHLMESEKHGQPIWLTLCGRKIRATDALPPQKFDAGENCCIVCVRMQRSNSLLHSRLRAA